jgi:hypothetical protein
VEMKIGHVRTRRIVEKRARRHHLCQQPGDLTDEALGRINRLPGLLG